MPTAAQPLLAMRCAGRWASGGPPPAALSAAGESSLLKPLEKLDQVVLLQAELVRHIPGTERALPDEIMRVIDAWEDSEHAAGNYRNASDLRAAAVAIEKVVRRLGGHYESTLLPTKHPSGWLIDDGDIAPRRPDL